VYDVARGSPTRLTFEGGGFPVWSPDDKRVGYSGSSLYAMNSDGSGKPELLTTGASFLIPSSWRSNAIAFLQRTERGTYAIWVLPMEGDRSPKLFLESRVNLTHAELSPDGHWMAYVSAESGRSEVYVQPYPGPGERALISTVGGTAPIWTANGREIVYISGTLEHQQFFSAPIRSVSPFRADPPRLLFEAKQGEYSNSTPTRSWDISPDGTKFLLERTKESTDKPVSVMNVVLNWSEELKRLAPQK
jgi:Tol biopolymer transport system component